MAQLLLLASGMKDAKLENEELRFTVGHTKVALMAMTRIILELKKRV